jgi:hypothetical protein
VNERVGEAYGMFPQGQLEGFPIVVASNHLLDHAVHQGQAEDIGDGSAWLGRLRRAFEHQARLWDNESRHFGRLRRMKRES